MFLEETPAFFRSGSSARIKGILTTGVAVKNHIAPKKGKRMDCNISNYVPFVVPGVSTCSFSSSTPTSSTSTSQDSVIGTENPPAERSGSAGEESLGNPLRKPAKKQTPIKMKETRKYRVICCMSCQTGCRSSERIWMMKVILWSHGETGPLGHRDTSSSCQARQAQCLHSLSERPRLRHLLEDENNESFWQKTCWYSRTHSGKFVDLITADNKVLSEGSESSWNHCASTPHRSETHGIAERAVRGVKGGTFAVL